MDGVYEHLDELKGKLKENLTVHEDAARLSRKLVLIEDAVSLTMTLDDARYAGFYAATFISFLEQLGFRSLIERLREGALAGYVLDDAVTQASQEKTAYHPAPSHTFSKAHVITGETTEGLDELTRIRADVNTPSCIVLYYDGARPHRAHLAAGAIAHPLGTVIFNRAGLIRHAALQQFFTDPAIKKVFYDTKRAMIAFERLGFPLQGYAGDGLIAQYLLDATRSSYTLSDLAAFFGETVPDDADVFGKGSKFRLPEEPVLFSHAQAQAEVFFRLYPSVLERLKALDLLNLYESIELPLVGVLARMEIAGIKIDRTALEEIGRSLLSRMKEVETEVYELAGVEFNVNSPKQLAEILFEKLMLPPQKKTKTGYSTDAETLEALAGAHPVIEPILTYRMLSKLYSTYVEGLIKEIHEDGKIHTTFHQALTSTGRLSSSEPNLQNIPMRQEEGRLLRKAFIPSEKNWRILSADYSQIELRVLAHMSGDPRLIEAFLHDEDIHTQTAMDVFHVKREEVSPLMRRHAKAVNFGIIYGISDFGLAQNLKISRQEAKAFITRYFEVYPEVRRFLDRLIEEAREKGYVTTLFGRRRELPEINDRNFARRSFAERTAMNTPIQGTAADIIKKAMVELERVLLEDEIPARMLLQVHDELVFEVDAAHAEALAELVRDKMSHAVALRVPLKVDVAYGPTWYDAK
ncbi:MAG: DNA polymerase I [Candidatus Carbobacillus altaicus]|uniref:DNA polymerase I n=1 Tax=Candidatus Carbonibacillus altaicus TaxID=2163959 RepID=A0A2R6XYD7_9BACL|nr:MAG: DNA polymerase I [Candidatus Carbobacillus altaicus]